MAMSNKLKIGSAATLLLGAMVLVGCGDKGGATTGGTGSATGGTTGGDNSAMSGSITIDGSSTVWPIVSIMGEDFGDNNKGVTVTVNKSGTGSGFQKFARGETDIATASRPIKDEEIESLKKANLEFIEIPIAYDGVSLIVSPQNNWVDKLTVDELNKAWAADSTVKMWSDIRPTFPKQKINFYGPTDNHGTYEYFTEAINKKKDAIRKDYQANQEYPAIVSAVAADQNGIAYVGYNYFAENQNKVKAVPVDAGSGAITPNGETISNGTYAPLSRPLFIYVSKKAYDSKPAVKAFVEYAIGTEGVGAVTEAKFVQLPQDALDAVKTHVTAGKTGTLFQSVKPGMSIAQVLTSAGATK
jgi:phosphate transport system substrate-binding protein